MAVYHQMGHHSDNLLTEKFLNKFSGAILSPVNQDKSEIKNLIDRYRDNSLFTTIFDPQLYFPRTSKQKLKDWSYFPNDYDTIAADKDWWLDINKKLFTCVMDIKPDAVCSPIQVPRIYSDSYYEQSVIIADDLYNRLSPYNIEVIQSVLVNIAELTDTNKLMTIASLILANNTHQVYLLLFSATEPRREIDMVEELKGAMKLINILEKGKRNVIVGFSSSDIILWKIAGATSCATGKFWNLRRFTPSRWDDADEGGGQMAYWFEEGLMASIRASDLSRIVAKGGIISNASINNPYYQEIISKIQTPVPSDGQTPVPSDGQTPVPSDGQTPVPSDGQTPVPSDGQTPVPSDGQTPVPSKVKGPPPWVGLGWRQYLYWFADIEERLNTNQDDPLSLLRVAEKNWIVLEDNNILMEERRNNGNWLRQWQRAIVEYDK